MADDSINFQFTAQGQQLATQALAGSTKLDFTKAVASTDNHFSDDAATIAALTTLDNVKQTASVTEVDAVANDDTEVRIPVTFDKSQVGDDYQLFSVGLYCKPDNGDEVLYAVAGLANPILMHKSDTSSVYSIALYVIVGTATQVTIKVDPAGSVTHNDLTAILADYPKTADLPEIISDNIPANILTKDNLDQQETTLAHTDAANVFSKQQTFSAGAVNGSGKKALFDGDVDLSGTQPKGDYATNPDLTALKNTVNSSTSGLPSKMATADANSKFETQADAKNKYVQDNHNGTINVNGVNAVPFDIPTVLPNNSDLFNIYGKAYTAWYSCSLDASAGTMKNIPNTYAFVLKVEPISYISGVASNGVPTWNTRLLTFTTRFGNSYMAIRSSDDKGNDTTSMPWKKIAFSTDVQSAINQAHTDMLSELTNRGYPASIWTGTQAQYDAMSSHDNHIEYRING